MPAASPNSGTASVFFTDNFLFLFLFLIHLNGLVLHETDFELGSSLV
jgi:hypothetical protein